MCPARHLRPAVQSLEAMAGSREPTTCAPHSCGRNPASLHRRSRGWQVHGSSAALHAENECSRLDTANESSASLRRRPRGGNRVGCIRKRRPPAELTVSLTLSEQVAFCASLPVSRCWQKTSPLPASARSAPEFAAHEDALRLTQTKSFTLWEQRNMNRTIPDDPNVPAMRCLAPLFSIGVGFALGRLLQVVLICFHPSGLGDVQSAVVRMRDSTATATLSMIYATFCWAFAVVMAQNFHLHCGGTCPLPDAASDAEPERRRIFYFVFVPASFLLLVSTIFLIVGLLGHSLALLLFLLAVLAYSAVLAGEVLHGHPFYYFPIAANWNCGQGED